MSTNDTFLAVFLGSKTSAKMAAWNALPEAERRAREQQGMAAWKAWVEKHQSAIVAISIFAIHLFGDLWSSQIMGALSDHWQSLQRAGLILPGALLVGAALWLALAVKTLRAMPRRVACAQAKVTT